MVRAWYSCQGNTVHLVHLEQHTIQISYTTTSTSHRFFSFLKFFIFIAPFTMKMCKIRSDFTKLILSCSQLILQLVDPSYKQEVQFRIRHAYTHDYMKRRNTNYTHCNQISLLNRTSQNWVPPRQLSIAHKLLRVLATLRPCMVARVITPIAATCNNY